MVAQHARNSALVLFGLLFGLAGCDGDETETEVPESVALSFSASTCFNADTSQSPTITFSGPDVLELEPYGTSDLEWELVVNSTADGFELVSGTFSWTLPDGDTLRGDYTGFELDQSTGDYTLDWLFAGGTGAMQNAEGDGITTGTADLMTFCADYSFAGEIQL